MWKTTFPKEFFNEIWPKVEEHEYIYIFKIKFEKKIILFKNGGRNKFWDIVQLCIFMLISVKMARPI